MKKILVLLAAGFAGTTRNTPEFKSFARKFKNALAKELETAGCTITAYNVGHFYVSGFFRNKFNDCYYFSISDVRHFKIDKMLWRTAKDEKDFTGGHNRSVFILDGMGRTIGDQIVMDKGKISFLITD